MGARRGQDLVVIEACPDGRDVCYHQCVRSQGQFQGSGPAFLGLFFATPLSNPANPPGRRLASPPGPVDGRCQLRGCPGHVGGCGDTP